MDTAQANNILIITASGNDSIYLDTLQQYPACYNLNNIITVGAQDTVAETSSTPYTHSDFSNYSPQFVDIIAPGKNITSTVPNNAMDKKTGTSMAAPAVAAAAINLKYLGVNNYSQIKNCIFSHAILQSNMANQVDSGRILNWGTGCIPITIFSSVQYLQSNATILTNAKIHFSSGNVISLSPGFEVKLGAEFKATMNGCINGN